MSNYQEESFVFSKPMPSQGSYGGGYQQEDEVNFHLPDLFNDLGRQRFKQNQ
jgi:hypothetical protein